MFATAELLEKERSVLAHKRQLFDAVQARLDQKEMERNIRAPISVMSRASVPSKAYTDQRVLYTALVLILAGLILTLLRWLLHRRGLSYKTVASARG